jgi:preprotein translocase subunit YajC
MTNLFISTAFAQEAAAKAQEPNAIMSMVPFVVIFAIMYFVLIRPQRKQQQEQQKKHDLFLTELQKGDEVVTQSGLIGKVAGVSDKIITLEVAQNVKIKVLKQTVLQKVDATVPA